MDKLTVPEAAERLGVTRDAVYKRVQRDQIPWDKDEEGRVYVYVDPSDIGEDSSTDEVQPPRDALIETLREEVEAWREESRRKDTIIAQMNQTIAALTERIPELEAPSEPRGSAERGTVTTPEVVRSIIPEAAKAFLTNLPTIGGVVIAAFASAFAYVQGYLLFSILSAGFGLIAAFVGVYFGVKASQDATAEAEKASRPPPKHQ